MFCLINDDLKVSYIDNVNNLNMLGFCTVRDNGTLENSDGQNEKWIQDIKKIRLIDNENNY